MEKDQPALTAEHARRILRFLERVEIRGSEAPAFMEIVAVLNAAAQPQVQED